MNEPVPAKFIVRILSDFIGEKNARRWMLKYREEWNANALEMLARGGVDRFAVLDKIYRIVDHQIDEIDNL